MNARLYDLVHGRFLAPDPYVQAPDMTQNFNRYTYALNNPLKFTDKSGELFIVDDWFIGFFRGLFRKGGGFKSAWQTANRQAVNAAKIWGGLFTADKSKNFFGKAWEIISRFTWQLPQTLAGFGYSNLSNTLGQVERVDYYGGATAVTHTRNSFMMPSAMTLGSFINGNNTLEANSNNPLFQHEYGHYLQSQASGLFYLSKYGIPSLLSKNPHNNHPVEQDANVRAFEYFNKNNERFREWDRIFNPINGYDWNLAFTDRQNQRILRRGKIRLAWYDFLLKPSIIMSGIVNALILNSKY